MTTPITLTGRLGKDPQIRYSQSGQPIANLSVAVDERRKNPTSGAWETTGTTWWPVTAFGTLAENVCESLAKGDSVIVTGRASERSWEKDGQQRSRMEVTADAVGPNLRWASAPVHRTTRTTTQPDDGGLSW